MEKEKTAIQQLIEFVKKDTSENRLAILKKCEQLIGVERSQHEKTFNKGFQKGYYHNNEIEKMADYYFKNNFETKD